MDIMQEIDIVIQSATFANEEQGDGIVDRETESDYVLQEKTLSAQIKMDLDTVGGATQEPPPIRLE